MCSLQALFYSQLSFKLFLMKIFPKNGHIERHQVLTLKAKFHQSSRSKAWSKTRVFDQAFVLLDRVCDLLSAHDKLRTFRVENLVESVLDLSQHVVIDLARFRPNRSCQYRSHSHTSLVSSAAYSLRTGSRHAFDVLSTCLRSARARHASLRPGFRPGFLPARLMEFGGR